MEDGSRLWDIYAQTAQIIHGAMEFKKNKGENIMTIVINDTEYQITDIHHTSDSKYVYVDNLTYDEIKQIFVKDLTWYGFYVYEQEEWDEEQEEIRLVEKIDTIDYSEYCIPGVITDYGNGSFSVELRKLKLKDLFPFSNTVQDVKDFLQTVDILKTNLSDDLAINYKNLYPLWEENHQYCINDRIRFNNNLYKVITEQISNKNPEEDNISYQKL